MPNYTPKEWIKNNLVTNKKIKNLDNRVTALEDAGGETITVDSALSDTSENPVQNKAITAAISAIGVPKTIHISIVAPEQEGDDPTITIEEDNEECYAIVVSGGPVSLELSAFGTKLYGVMYSCVAQSTNLWFAKFVIFKTFTSTSISLTDVVLTNPADGKRFDYDDFVYNFSS